MHEEKKGEHAFRAPGASRSEEPEYKKIRRSLNRSMIDGSLCNMMEGFTTPFMSAYGILLQSSNLMISFLSSVPVLFAAVFQLLAIKVNETFKSRKQILFVSALIQAALWIPILLIPKLVSDKYQAILLIVLYSLVTTMSNFMAPIWRSLMGDLVPENERGSYFSKRNKVISIFMFLSTLSAGFILQHFSKISPFTGFAILFIIAFFARSGSAILLAMTYEKKTFNPNEHHYADYKYTLSRFLKDLNRSDYGKFVLFICLFRIAVNISSPFTTVYELRYLNLSYLQFTMLTVVEIITSILFMGLWGKLNDEKGSKYVILISGLLIPLNPLLYLFGTNYYYLIFISAFSGAIWAGFNLAVGNFMFDASSPQERVRYASYYNLFNGISVFIGAMLGGLIVNFLPQTAKGVLIIFFISFLGRLLVALFLFPSLHEMRLVELPFGKSFFNYPLIITPRHRFVQDSFDYYLAYPNKPKKPRPRLYIEPQFIQEPPDPEKQRLEKWKVKKFLERYTPPIEKKK